MGTVKAEAASLRWELMFTRSMFKTDDMIEQHKLLSVGRRRNRRGRLRTTVAQKCCVSHQRGQRARSAPPGRNGRGQGNPVIVEGW